MDGLRLSVVCLYYSASPISRGELRCTVEGRVSFYVYLRVFFFLRFMEQFIARFMVLVVSLRRFKFPESKELSRIGAFCVFFSFFLCCRSCFVVV